MWAMVGQTWTNLLEYWRRGTFLRSMSVLVGGAAVGYAVLAAVYPLLTRMYDPRDFGVMAIYVSVTIILRAVAALRYEQAILLPQEDQAAYVVLVLCIVIVVGFSAALGLVVWAKGDLILNWLNAQELRNWVWLFALGLFVKGTCQVLTVWAVRRKAFPSIAKMRFSQGLGEASSQLVGGLLHIGPLGLLLGHLIGQAAGTGVLASLVWGQDRQRHKGIVVRPRGLIEAAYRFRRFPLLSSWAALMDQLGVQLPVLLLAVWYGSQVTGWYSLVERFFGAPSVLLGMAMAQVYDSEAAGLVRSTHTCLSMAGMRRLLGKTIKSASLLGLPLLLMAATGPWTFPWAFGANWAESGLYAVPFGLMSFVAFVVIPTGGTVDVLERQDLHLVREGVRLALMAGALGLAVALGVTPRTAMVFLGVAGTIGYIFYGLVSVYAIRSARRTKDD